MAWLQKKNQTDKKDNLQEKMLLEIERNNEHLMEKKKNGGNGRDPFLLFDLHEDDLNQLFQL